MITELANLLDNFPGAANQTCCFAHIVNLVVKSILLQFDVYTKRNGPLDNTADEILKLAVDLDLEEELSGDNDEDGEQGEDDNYEGWIDERDQMSEEQLEELEDHVQPIRLLLIKACELKVIPCDDTHVKFNKVVQISICNQELLNHHPSEMVLGSQGPGTRPQNDASRCPDTLELDV